MALTRREKAKAGLALASLFTLTTGLIGSAVLPDLVPDMIETGHDTAARATVRFLSFDEPQWRMDRNLDAALENKKLELAAFMISHGANPEEAVLRLDSEWDYRGEKIVRTKEDYDQSLRFLLREGHLAERKGYMRESSQKAARDDKIEKLKILIEFDAPVDGNLLGYAASTHNDEIPALNYLLENFFFSASDKEKAMKQAVSYGTKSALERLDGEAAPGPQELNAMLLEAAQKDRPEIVAFLLANHDFDDAIRTQALADSLGAYGSVTVTETFEYLMREGKIPDSYKTEIIRNAIAGQSHSSTRLMAELEKLYGKKPASPAPAPR